jgi:hypothetical protein
MFEIGIIGMISSVCLAICVATFRDELAVGFASLMAICFLLIWVW